MPQHTESPTLPALNPDDAAARSEHLLKVTHSVNADALAVWNQLWGQLKPHVNGPGRRGEKGFVPDSEFLDRFWLLKHYLDSVARICGGKH